MNKKTHINLKIWILMAAVFLLFIIINTAIATTTIEPGSCISLPNGSSFCATMVICSRSNVTFACSPNIPACPACPAQTIQNEVKNNFTIVQQPIIAKETLIKAKPWAWAVLTILVVITLWKTGIFSYLTGGTKMAGKIARQDYYNVKDTVERATRNIPRQNKEGIEDIE